MNRQFHLGDVLSVTTGRLLSPNGIAGVYAILNFMTGDTVFTHQLGRFADECKPYLLKQHPGLAAVDHSEVTSDYWNAWLTDQVLKFGEQLEVQPLPEGEHYYIEPISELAEKVHPSQIRVVMAPKK